ncbi:MAG: ATP-binding protein [Candidatus Margulisbacteria bacterium]|jgi:AAA15 family ATPase/GTPase|nr:ATP-binding protein [Candidatus Margulisiibacteriota bacterium]
MELTKIEIENFRSIKSQTIIFDNNCLILLGKNEAGKSNILKAIAAVFGQYIVSDKDRRKRINNEKIENYFVRAILKLSEKDIDDVLSRFKAKYVNTECIVFKSHKSIRDFIKSVFYEYLIQIDIANNEKVHFSYGSYSGTDFECEKEVYLSGKSFTTEVVGAEQNLQACILEVIEELYKENVYRCHYWQYDEKTLLSNSVVIADFIASPTKYRSLENIFVLCKRENIKNEFSDAKSQDGDYENLLSQISKTVTQTFRKIWKDFKDTSIELRPNGDEISIKVVNETKYSFEDRSDGFKKFISILLMLSTKDRSNMMSERDIILIDEPDQSLYPTSARYLRDELLKISEHAKMIYSTHSQYMIDSNCIDRHLVVEKKDDVTTAVKPDRKAPFSSDELLRNAIGASIFECIQDKNIIFEGWLDKELFQKYCAFNKKVNDFKNIGMVYLKGISGVECLVQLLILAHKKFIIVSDSDTVSNSKRNEFVNAYPEFSESWLAYADVVKDISTMEDFISSKLITNYINKDGSTFVYNEKKSAIENIETVTNGNKEEKQSMKNEIMKAVSKNDIKTEYGDFISHLKDRIDKL